MQDSAESKGRSSKADPPRQELASRPKAKHQKSTNYQKEAVGGGRDIWKQYEEFKLLDKVLPNPAHTAGCFVQLDESGFGVIEQVSQPRPGDKREDTSKYLCHIRRGTQGDKKAEVVKAESNKVKYLARAYLCRASEL